MYSFWCFPPPSDSSLVLLIQTRTEYQIIMIRHISDLRYLRQGDKSSEEGNRGRGDWRENWIVTNEMLGVNSPACLGQRLTWWGLLLSRFTKLSHFPHRKQYFLLQLLSSLKTHFFPPRSVASFMMGKPRLLGGHYYHCWFCGISPHNSKYWC